MSVGVGLVALPGLISASSCSALVTVSLSNVSLPLGLVVGACVCSVVAAFTTGLVPEFQWFANTFVLPVFLQRRPVQAPVAK